jgi:hypothetical protein
MKECNDEMIQVAQDQVVINQEKERYSLIHKANTAIIQAVFHKRMKIAQVLSLSQ